ncbi:hydrogenase maturation protein HypF [Clostridiales bacterium PH28_bin88]|nr:hydrogenase maturation protein HypF [Clostridiales bacterium PH28_bin88]
MAGAAVSPQRIRYRLSLRGTVQGVGFRPFVYRLAGERGLTGWVENSSGGLVVEVEGEEPAVEDFSRELVSRPPGLARVEEVRRELLPPAGYTEFRICASREEERREAAIPPDTATCPDCRREVLDPRDRHYLYPFTNCTRCGPRYTIVRELPYDRERTAMKPFPLCPDCAREFHDPLDRRFHAQPVACPSCGPRVELVDMTGKRLTANAGWLEALWQRLQAGQVVAIKGLGGFHLACNAADATAVAGLRRRKEREAKPLAVMCRDLEVVRRHCRVGPAEVELLTSPKAPIVILDRRPDCLLPEALSPGLDSLGVMLPYTPLHLLIMNGPLDVLVMTSANPGDLPMVKDNHEALERLQGMADAVLWHDRDIPWRCDDSLVRVAGRETLLFRRSRGYVPSSFPVPAGKEGVALGAGGEMKNAFCLVKNGRAYLSPHIGEMGSLETQESYRDSLAHLQDLVGAAPQVVGYDLHPGYHSSRLARSLPAVAVGVQHHHAHLASCLADNGCRGPALGAVLDGTGYGSDGRLWGCEILSGDFLDFQRHCHLRYLPLPGGEVSVKRPWRMAVAYLHGCLGEEGMARARRMFGSLWAEELAVVERMLATGFNSPLTSSAGRLFDAVAALLGICPVAGYEGEAAARLEALARRDGGTAGRYPSRVSGEEMDPGPLLMALLEDLDRGRDPALIARRFHLGVAAMVTAAVERAAEAAGLPEVALSGGVWQNSLLLETAARLLKKKGFRVLRHRETPTNDGGLALGQAMVAYWRWRQGVPGNTHEGD